MLVVLVVCVYSRVPGGSLRAITRCSPGSRDPGGQVIAVSLDQRLRSPEESRARGAGSGAMEALHRGPHGPHTGPGPTLPASDTQTGRLFAFCFVFLSPPICWKNTQTPRLRGPGLAAPAARGPEAKCAKEEAACACPRAPGPQGPGRIPPAGSGACAHPQGCILGGRGPSSGPANAGLLEDTSWARGPPGRSRAWGLWGL